MAELWAQPVRADLGPNPGPADPPHLLLAQRPRTVDRGTGTIFEAFEPLFTEPPDPLVGGRPGDPAHVRSVRDRPTEFLHPVNDQPAPERGEPRLTM
jgi:hypothetical protein